MSGIVWQQTELDFGVTDKTELPTALDMDAHCRRIAGHLTVRLPEPVDVVFTNNRSTMVSFKNRGGRINVRLHRLFRHAGAGLLDFLALYLGKRDKAASLVIDKFIAAHKDEICSPIHSKPKPLRHEGSHYNLLSILNRVNKTYFDSKAEVLIGWGRAPNRRRKRRRRTMSRALATYSFDQRTIRVNPVLDASDIPEYILEWIVYHELLHHVLPVEENGGKRRYHTRRFKALERAFIRYEEAKTWERVHLDRLLL